MVEMSQLQYSRRDIERMIQLYAARPSMFSTDQIGIIKNHAEYYKLPFAEDPDEFNFNLLRAIRKAGEGYIEGFTTLKVGKQAINPIEKIFGSVGQLAGFVGYLPGLPANILTKIGLKSTSRLFRTLTAARALSAKGFTSAPMWVAGKAEKAVAPFATKFLAKAATGEAKAAKIVGQFLAKDIPRDMIAGAFHMGTASAVSGWQGGVDDMMKSFARGAGTGAGFRLLGNLAGPSGLIDVNDKNVIKGINILSHSLHSGLPATMRGESTPQQVYEYLLGAYFGSKSSTSVQNLARKWVTNTYSPEANKKGIVDIETVPGFENLSVGVQTESRNIISDQYAPHLTNKIVEDLSNALGVSYNDVKEKHGKIIYEDVVASFKEPYFLKNKAIRERLQANVDIEIVNIIKKYAIEMDSFALHSGIGDDGDFVKTEPIESKMKDFVTKYAIGGEEFNIINIEHANAYDSIVKKWNKLQPYGQKKNNYDKMVEWTIANDKLPGATEESRVDIERFWKRRAAERKNLKRKKGYNTNQFGVLIERTGDKTPTGQFFVKYGTEQQLEKDYKKSYIDLFGEKPKDDALVFVDTMTNDTFVPTGDSTTGKEWKLKQEMSDAARQPLSDAAKGKIVFDMDKKGYGYFSGIGDKAIQKFIKRHPVVEKLVKEGKLDEAYENIIKEMSTSLGKDKTSQAKVEKALRQAEKEYVEAYTSKDSRGHAAIYRKTFLSNVYYDMMRNGINNKTVAEYLEFTNSEGVDFVNTIKAFNKREQIWNTDGLPVDSQLYKESTGRKRIRVAILEELKNKGLDITSEALKYAESTDGATFVLEEDMAAMANSLGIDPDGNMLKPFIISPHQDYGAMLGKMNFFLPPKELAEYMRKNNIQMVSYKSAVKQRGARKLSTIKDGKFYIKDANGNLLEAKDDNGFYYINPDDIKIVMGKIVDSHYGENATIASQIFSNMHLHSHKEMDQGVIRDFFDSTLGAQITGEKVWNDKLSDFMLTGGDVKAENDILNNIDKIGVNTLFEAIHSKNNPKLAVKILQRIYRTNTNTFSKEVKAYDLTENEATELINQGFSFKTVAEKILNGTDPSLYAFLDPYVSKHYAGNVINGYIRKRLTRPIAENSLTSVMRPITEWDMKGGMKLINTHDNIFFLGKRFAGKKIRDSRLPNGQMALGQVVAEFNNKKNSKETRKVMEEIISNVMVTRAPIESASGVQKMIFGGFSDYNDYSIMLHGRTMQALAGADLDGDTAMVYFGGNRGMKQSWADLFLAQKGEFYSTRKDGKTISKPGGFIDPETGKSFVDAQTIASPHEKFLMNDPSMKYNPMARQHASSKASEWRAGLGYAVNTKQQIVSAYNEMVDADIQYDYVYTSKDIIDKKTGKVKSSGVSFDVSQRVKKDESGKKGTKKLSVIDRINKTTSASARILVDPMDYDGAISIGEMIELGHKVAFDYVVRDKKTGDVLWDSSTGAERPEYIPAELLSGGVTKLFRDFKSSLRGQNQYEARPYTQLERYEISRALTRTFPEARSTLTMQAKLSESLDYSDSLFRRTTSDQVQSLYDSFLMMNIDGQFKLVSDVVGKVGKYGKKEAPVKKHKLIDNYLRHRLFDKYEKQRFIEENSWSARKFMKTKWYGKLMNQIESLPSYDEFKAMSIGQRAKAMRAIDLVAEDFLANDIRDMTSAMATTALTAIGTNGKGIIKNMNPESVKKVWALAESVKKINEPGYRVNGKLLNREQVIDMSDARAVEIKKNLTEAESKLFDGFMLSTFRGEGSTLSTSQALSMRSTNLGVIKAYYGIYDEIFGKISSSFETPETKEALKELEMIRGNTYKLVDDVKAPFIPESREDLLKGIEFVPGDKTELNERASKVVSNLKEFATKNNLFADDINLFSHAINHKSLNQSNLTDLEDLARIFKGWQAGGSKLIEKNLVENIDARHPELSPAYQHMFPRWVGEHMRKWGLVPKLGLAPYIGKDGEVHVGGLGLTASHPILETQNIADYGARMESQIEGKMRASFMKEVDPLMVGDKALDVWKAMVATMIEPGVVESGYARDGHEIAYNENKKHYLKVIADMGDMRHPVRGVPGGLSTQELMKEMHKSAKKVFQTIFTWHTGEPGYIDKYKVKQALYKGDKRIDVESEWFRRARKSEDVNAWYEDMLKSGWKPGGKDLYHHGDMPVFNYKAFYAREVNDKMMIESPVSMKIGTHQFRLIEHSMQLTTSMHRDPKFIENLMNSAPSMPRSLGDFFYPHNGYDTKIQKAELDKVVKRIIESKDMSTKRKIEEFNNLTYYSREELLSAVKEQASDSMWNIVGPEINEKYMSERERKATTKFWETTIISKHERRRQAHHPGWELGPEAVTNYIKSESKQLMRHASQIGIRNNINEAYYRGKKDGIPDGHLVKLIDFYRQQATSALGFAQILPEDVLKDPEAGMKGSLMEYFADNIVADKLNKIGEKLGLIAEEPVEGAPLSAIEARLKSWRFDETNIRHFAQIEAKYQLAALLSHPKTSTGNIYGGTTNTLISTGISNFKASKILKDLTMLNKDWDSWEKVNEFIVQHGVLEEFMIHQAGVSIHTSTAKHFKNFMNDAIRAITKDPTLSDKGLFAIARKHKISEALVDKAAWFMKSSERVLRRDAFLSHLIQEHKNWEGILPYDHPFIIKRALDGVKATQFLYSAPFRPAFSNTALGKIMTRFQLWSWNSVRFRNDIISQAQDRGYREGTVEFDRLKRMALADIMAVGLSQAFMYTIFESALPAPYSWIQDMADYMFGDEKERERAFFGAYPGILKPMQLITPSALRLVGPTMSAIAKNDFAEISSYHIWSIFPFGRIARDVVGPGNVFQNPSMFLEKSTGLPYRGVIQYAKKVREMDDY